MLRRKHYDLLLPTQCFWNATLRRLSQRIRRLTSPSALRPNYYVLCPSSDVILNPERSATPATVQVKQTFAKGANKDPYCAPWQETWLECTQPPSKERPKQR